MLSRSATFFSRSVPYKNVIRSVRRYITQENSKKKVKQENSTLGKVFFSAICIATGGLGVWQMQRYQWKVELLEEMKKTWQLTPIQVHSITELLDAPAGRKVELCGYFEHEKEIFLGPRSAPSGVFPATQGMASNPSGYYVIAPFILKDSNQRIFVNRGWIRKKTDNWERPTGEVKFTAAVSRLEKETTFSPKNDVSNKTLLWLEDHAILAATGVGDNFEGPIVLADAIGSDIDATHRTLPLPKINDSTDAVVQPITHLTYATTWFSLSAIGFYMTYLRFRR